MDPDDDLPDEYLFHMGDWAFVHGTPEKLAVAVSGGGDSMACLDLMRRHGDRAGFPVVAVTVDHGLRPEAADEIALVARYCADYGVDHVVLAWSWDGKGNLQAAARDARYGLISAWARESCVDTVALGHTMDDVAETFLMRLAREAGVDGLAHMEARFEREGVTWIRPLMSVGRQDWRRFLKRHNIQWADDPSNDDDRFERVRARQVLSALDPLEITAETLVGVATHMASARSAIEHYVFNEARKYAETDRGDLILPGEFAEKGHLIPPEVMFRLRRAAISWVGGGDYPPGRDAMATLAVTLPETETYTLGGCRVDLLPAERAYERKWRITREFNAVRSAVSVTDAVWDGRWVLDGPHAANLEVRALGEAVKDTPWRARGMPRAALMASPAVWDGATLVAAPVAGLGNGWSAEATGRGTFTAFLLSR